MGKGGGFHSISWNVVTLSKAEGSLGLRNLRKSKFALLAKRIFALINRVDKIWANIFLSKYINWSIWNSGSYSNTSSFFKAICKTADVLKPNLCLSVCNPIVSKILDDPWCLDLPLRFKPTF